jgi:hypothetical protein
MLRFFRDRLLRFYLLVYSRCSIHTYFLSLLIVRSRPPSIPLLYCHFCVCTKPFSRAVTSSLVSSPQPLVPGISCNWCRNSTTFSLTDSLIATRISATGLPRTGGRIMTRSVSIPVFADLIKNNHSKP